MARNFFRIFTENNPVMGYSKTFFIPEAKGLRLPNRVYGLKLKTKYLTERFGCCLNVKALMFLLCNLTSYSELLTICALMEYAPESIRGPLVSRSIFTVTLSLDGYTFTMSTMKEKQTVCINVFTDNYKKS